MNRQQQAARRIGIGQVRENEVVTRRVAAGSPARGRPLVIPVSQRGLVAMVAVRDHDRPIGQEGLDARDGVGVADCHHAVMDAGRIDRFDRLDRFDRFDRFDSFDSFDSRAGIEPASQQRGQRLLRILVEQEDRR